MSFRAHLSQLFASSVLLTTTFSCCTGCSTSEQTDTAEVVIERASPPPPQSQVASPASDVLPVEPDPPPLFSDELTAALTSPAPVASGLELRKELDAVTADLIKKIPRNADLLELRARFLSLAGDYAAAKDYWKQAIVIDPEYGYAYQGLGRAAKLEGDLESAIANFQTALETQPDNAELVHQYADTQTALGNTRKALEMLDEFSKRHPQSAQTWLLLGNAQLAEKEYEQAEQSYRQVLAAYPDNPRARRGLTTVLVRLGRRDEARQFMRDSALDTEAREQNRNDVEILRDEMIASANIYYQAALVLVSQHENLAATSLAQRATVLDPKNLSAWRLLLNLNQQLEPAVLVEIGQAMVRANPEDASARLELGWLQLVSEQPKAAANAFEEVLKMKPQDTAALFGLSTALLRTPNEGQRALEQAKDLVALQPIAKHFDLLAQAYAVNGNYVEALSMIEKALSEDPQNAQYQFARQQLINLLGAPK